MGIPGFDVFELDIESALRRDLPPFIERFHAASLIEENINRIPPKTNGVYLLFRGDEVKYVGKTTAKKGFHARLSRHAFHFRHRKNVEPGTISFKAISIPVFHVADIEKILIRHFNAEWNNSGIGSNDTGKNRDTQKVADFDLQYSVNPDIPLEIIQAGSIECKEILDKIKKYVPYTFRYERKINQSDLRTEINIPFDNLNLREVLQLIVNSLPHKVWQATIFHGRVILYPETIDYIHSQDILRPQPEPHNP